MKLNVSTIKKTTVYKANADKVNHWVKLISITGGAQVIIQIIGFLCAILIIRNFTIKEYALYTLTNTMIAAMSILSDGGIISGVMAEGGKVWNDKTKLGIVIATGMNLRRKFATISLLITGSIFMYLLVHNHAAWYYAILIILSIIPVFYASLTDSILEISPRLHQDIKSLQINQLFACIGRLLLIVSTVFIFPFTPIANLATGIPRIFANIRLRKISDKFIDASQKESAIVKANIIRMVKKILPYEVYNMFSVNITVWILSIVGSTNSIGQVGALFRIGAILSVISIMFTTLIIPRYSRLQENRKILIDRMVKIQLLLIFIGVACVAATWIFSKQIIWILGKNYAHLEKELVLTIIIFCLNFAATIISMACRGRGWVISPVLSISINLASIVIGAFIFNIKTLSGILIFNIAVSSVLVLMHSVYSFIMLAKLKF